MTKTHFRSSKEEAFWVEYQTRYITEEKGPHKTKTIKEISACVIRALQLNKKQSITCGNIIKDWFQRPDSSNKESTSELVKGPISDEFINVDHFSNFKLLLKMLHHLFYVL